MEPHYSVSEIEGIITLYVMLGKLPYVAKRLVKFYVVQVEIPHNAILGRPLLFTFKFVESIPYLKLKFLSEKGIGEMRGDQKMARIIMLENLEKDQELEKPSKGGKRMEPGPIGSRQTVNIKLKKFGGDLSSPIVEP